MSYEISTLMQKYVSLLERVSSKEIVLVKKFRVGSERMNKLALEVLSIVNNCMLPSTVLMPLKLFFLRTFFLSPHFTKLRIADFLEKVLSFCVSPKDQGLSLHEHYDKFMRCVDFMRSLASLHSQYVDLKYANKLREEPAAGENSNPELLRYEVDKRDKIEEAYYFLSSKGRDFFVKVERFLKSSESFSNSHQNFGFLEIGQVRKGLQNLCCTHLNSLLKIYKRKSHFCVQSMKHLLENKHTTLQKSAAKSNKRPTISKLSSQ